MTNKRDHITPVLARLHWLPVTACIQFKIALLTFKTLTTHQPSYIHDLLQLHCSSQPLRSTSHSLLEILQTRLVSVNAASPTVLHTSGTVYLTSSLATWTSLQTFQKETQNVLQRCQHFKMKKRDPASAKLEGPKIEDQRPKRGGVFGDETASPLPTR